MVDDLHFLRLWDMYAPLLTATQKEITDLYFNYDLSLGEIAEQKGVSRQSVSDCLNKSRKQLETYEKKLGFIKGMSDLSMEYSAYMTTVQRWLDEQKTNHPEMENEFTDLETSLGNVWKEFGVEVVNGDVENPIIGRSFRKE